MPSCTRKRAGMGPRHDAVSNRVRPPPGVLKGEHRVHRTTQIPLPHPAVHAQAAARGHQFHRCPVSFTASGRSAGRSWRGFSVAFWRFPVPRNGPRTPAWNPCAFDGSNKKNDHQSSPAELALAARATLGMGARTLGRRRAHGAPSALVRTVRGRGGKGRMGQAWGRQVDGTDPAVALTAAACLRQLSGHPDDLAVATRTSFKPPGCCHIALPGPGLPAPSACVQSAGASARLLTADGTQERRERGCGLTASRRSNSD